MHEYFKKGKIVFILSQIALILMTYFIFRIIDILNMLNTKLMIVFIPPLILEILVVSSYFYYINQDLKKGNKK